MITSTVETKKNNLLIVSLVALGMSLLALPAAFTVFRQNRLSEGIIHTVWRSVEPSHAFVLPVLLAGILLSIIFYRRRSWYPILAASLGTIFIVCVFLALADAAHYLPVQNGSGRVSLGSGAWLLLLGGYILTLSASKEIRIPYIRIGFSYLSVIVVLILGSAGVFNGLSVMQELIVKRGRFLRELYNHVSLSFSSVGFALLFGIPLGIAAYRKAAVKKIVFYFVNTTQTIPSLALFGLLIAPLSYLSTRFPLLRDMGIRGIGRTPALIALTLYALLPITRNLYTSLQSVDSSFIEAGKGMGLSRLQLLLTIEIPLAAPLFLNGIRLAAVQAVGNTTVAALIGAGGFGFFIFQGLGQAAPDLILLGAIPVVILAVLLDRSMQLLISVMTPTGILLQNKNRRDAV